MNRPGWSAALFCVISFAASLALPSLARAVSPALSAMQPYGFQRGTTTEVTFSGARLDDAEELLLYSPGVTITEVKPEKANVVKAKVTVAADCRMGIHALRLRSATGVSNLRTFSIGALPEVAEVEPNSEFLEPQAIEFGCTVNGIVQNEDVDYYVIEAKQGDRISAELEGLRLGNTFFDPYLAILNSERFELARSDDVSLLYQDCLCAVVAPADGKYIVQVRESAYGGNGSSKYRLHVGKFPRPRGVYPAGGKPGETLTVTYVGDAAGDFTSQITLPAVEGEFGLYAEDSNGIAPSPNMVRVVDVDNFQEVEPNNDVATATQAAGPGALNGVLGEPGDVDYFKFTAKKGTRYTIQVYARNTLRSPLDSVLYVQRSTGANVINNDDSGGPDSKVAFVAPADDEYRVMIRDHLQAGGPNYLYRIEITPSQPALTTSLPEKTRYIPTILSVHSGNRAALMVNASRAGFGGELNLDFPNMPAGMTFEVPVMPANRSTIPVLFSAAAGAAPAGALVEVVGTPVDEKVKVPSQFKQRTLLVRGQNNRDVWGHDADRMAAVLAAKVPFTIQIVQPKVPVTRAGSLGLKIVATRDEGFTAPILVRMLYNPPGIGSSASISIPEGKNEASIPITANDGAAIGMWPIVVTGVANAGGGNVEVASQMAQLEISDRYFNFAFEKSAAELGQETEMIVNVEKRSEWEGTAVVKLLGLPANTTCLTESVEITRESTQMVFRIKVDEKAKPGKNTSLVCRAIITRDGEQITTTLGSGELRIDKPLPAPVEKPKVAAAPAAPKPAAAPAPKPVKRLSRLEQLRLAREAKLKAAGN